MLLSLFNLLIGLFLFYILIKTSKRKHQLSIRIIYSLVLGVGYGFLLKAVPQNSITFGVEDVLHLIGSGYLALLKMLVIPLILTSIIHAIVHLGKGNNDFLKKMGAISVAMLLGMTAVASLITLGVGELFHVGRNLSFPVGVALPKHPSNDGIVTTLLGMIPSNPVAVMANENTVAIVIFAILLGLAARLLDVADHDKMETFRQLFASLFAIVKRLASMILSLTPYAVLSLMALLILNQGTALLAGMLTFIVAIYVAMALVFLMHLTILACLGIRPIDYLRKAVTPLFVAFTTRSSFGTLPVAEATLREKFKTQPVISTFVPSLGATIGMNACAGVFPAMLVMMTLTMLHLPLTPHLVLMVMFVNMIASLGISGIPGTAYIAATISLTSLNLPFAIIALVQGIDPIVDMGRTATNVNGVLTAALVTDKALK